MDKRNPTYIKYIILNKISILLFICLIVSCDSENNQNNLVKTDSLENIEKTAIVEEINSEIDEDYNESEGANTLDFSDTLFSYFKRNELKPLIDKSFNDGNDTTTYFKIGKHIINWVYNDSLTILRIDDEKINLNINGFEGTYSIGGIKLFSIEKREILAIVFNVVGCGGGCFDGNTLFYDFRNRKENYYSYVAMNCFSLYDFKNDNSIELLVPKFEGDVYGRDKFIETYSLFELNNEGHFFAKKDKLGKAFFIKVEYPNRSPESKCEIKSINWFENIKY
ncbi:MAG: hypothetical protein ACOYMA_14205 [Bacteroidia bacterium]